MLKGYFNRADDARVNVLRHILSSGGSRPLTVLNVTPPFQISSISAHVRRIVCSAARRATCGSHIGTQGCTGFVHNASVHRSGDTIVQLNATSTDIQVSTFPFDQYHPCCTCPLQVRDQPFNVLLEGTFLPSLDLGVALEQGIRVRSVRSPQHSTGALTMSPRTAKP